MRTAVDRASTRHRPDRDGCAEALDQLRLFDAAVFDHVMQQRGLDGGAVEAPVGQDLRDRERMRDVGRAAAAELAEMRFIGKAKRFLDLLNVGRRQILLDAIGQRGDGGDCARRVQRQARSARPPF